MKQEVIKNLKESFISVFPIVIIVLLINTFIKLPNQMIISFLISSVLLIIGITLFTVGADSSMMSIGGSIGKWLMSTKKISLILIFSFILGIAITIAEPDLRVLANQLSTISNFLIIGVVGLGVGIFFVASSLRILFKIDFSKVLILGYLIVFILMFIAPISFIPISFDSSGVTTGAISVPFIMTFGLGLVKNIKSSKNDSFGLVGLASIGPIVTMLILGILYKPTEVTSSVTASTTNILSLLTNKFITSFKEIIIAIIPIVLIFIVFQLITHKFKGYELKKVIIGLLVTAFGLILFLTGANCGFINVGYAIGSSLAKNSEVLIIIGFILGFFIVMAEPAIKVLTTQVEEITNGSISKGLMKLFLSIGVGLAVSLAMFRIVSGVSFLYFVIPGYIIALVLTFFTPKLFTAIAFDSGGAASGSLTATFLVPIALGACSIMGGNMMTDAFGLVAFVSMVPLITIQIMGIIYEQSRKKQVIFKADETIVDYDWGVVA